MAKRKSSQNGSAASDSDDDMLDIEFEWFDPAEVDFHGTKQLLKQLFDADHETFNLSALADLIISQPSLGSVVKVADDENEAKDNDPFAFLTVLNLQTHRTRPEIQTLTSYLTSKAQSTPSLQSLAPLLTDPAPGTQMGLILTERFINMPAEIVPPMYRMLLSEIAAALQENQPYQFTHYLILSKSYTEVASSLPGVDDEDTPAKKKKKGKGASVGGETFLFHAEDEVWQRHAAASGEFAYSKEADEGASDAKRAFQEAGIRPVGTMMLVEAGRFAQAVADVETYIGGAAVG